MKNKNGFTLIELLAVIAILALIVVIAVPSVVGINGLIKQNMLEKKGEIIEEAAVLLGQDMKGSIMASSEKYKTYPCKSVIVSYLVPNYLDKDNENECLKEDSTGTVGCIVDPSDSNKYLDKKKVIIYYKNKRIHAVVDLDDTLSCS